MIWTPFQRTYFPECLSFHEGKSKHSVNLSSGVFTPLQRLCVPILAILVVFSYDERTWNTHKPCHKERKKKHEITSSQDCIVCVFVFATKMLGSIFASVGWDTKINRKWNHIALNVAAKMLLLVWSTRMEWRFHVCYFFVVLLSPGESKYVQHNELELERLTRLLRNQNLAN